MNSKTIILGMILLLFFGCTKISGETTGLIEKNQNNQKITNQDYQQTQNNYELTKNKEENATADVAEEVELPVEEMTRYTEEITPPIKQTQEFSEWIMNFFGFN